MNYYKYDPQEDEYSLLYKSDKDEQIAGFSAENNVIYLIRKNGERFFIESSLEINEFQK